MGPNELTAYEAAMSIVADLGLPARDAAEAARAAGATGKLEEAGWYERQPILSEMWVPERFPVLTRIGAEGGFNVPQTRRTTTSGSSR